LQRDSGGEERRRRRHRPVGRERRGAAGGVAAHRRRVDHLGVVVVPERERAVVEVGRVAGVELGVDQQDARAVLDERLPLDHHPRLHGVGRLDEVGPQRHHHVGDLLVGAIPHDLLLLRGRRRPVRHAEDEWQVEEVRHVGPLGQPVHQVRLHLVVEAVKISRTVLAVVYLQYTKFILFSLFYYICIIFNAKFKMHPGNILPPLLLFAL